MFFKKEKKNYNYAFIGAIIIAVVAFAAVFIYKMDGGKTIPADDVKKEANETDKLLNDNKDALDAAKNTPNGEVKAISESDHIIGDLKAPVQMIVYSDFECPYCANFAETVKTIVKEFGDKIVIAYRHFPLSSHQYAVPAAIASECAAEQGKFWEMHDKIFAANAAQKLNVMQLKEDAADLGLNRVKFNQCLETEKYKDKVTRDMLDGRNAGATGTPTTFLNGLTLPGAYPFNDFTDSGGYARKGMKTLIEKALTNL